jgi:serine protease AprX
MRLWRPSFATFVVALATCAIAVAAATASDGRSQTPDGKIQARLARLAASLHDPDARIPVIVVGDGAVRAGKTHGRGTRALGLVGGAGVAVAAKDLHALAAEDGVSYVALDAPVAPDGLAAPSTPVSASSLASLYPGRIKANMPWSAGYTGAGVGIAVVDSGAVPSADFGTRLVQVRLDGQDAKVDDTYGHGTLVAGIAAGRATDGRYIGVAPAATVYALNVNRDGGTRSSDVITALKWVFDNAHQYNIRVVNLSLGETVQSSYLQNPLDLAVERLWAAGVFVVVSAGNRGAGAVDYAPAHDPLVMSVGAFDLMGTSGPGDDTVSPWSSYGETVNKIKKPELLAPGRRIESILSAGTALDGQAPAANRLAGGYANPTGTSFAAPQVAGAAAIAFQGHPTWSPDNVKWLLLAKSGANVRGSKIPTLDLSSAYNYAGTPGLANQKVQALVCAPGSTCLTGDTIASAWDASSWNASSWNSSEWSASSWNASSWNTVADWDASSWNASSWNASSWNGTDWNSILWD